MFTVKHVRPDGNEVLYNSDGWFQTLKQRDGTGPIIAVKFDDGDKKHFLDTGRVYVMNAAGQTVASYTLGAAPAADNRTRYETGGGPAIGAVPPKGLRDDEAIKRNLEQIAKAEKTDELRKFVSNRQTSVVDPKPAAEFGGFKFVVNPAVPPDTMMPVTGSISDAAAAHYTSLHDEMKAQQEQRAVERREKLAERGQQAMEAGGRPAGAMVVDGEAWAQFEKARKVALAQSEPTTNGTFAEIVERAKRQRDAGDETNHDEHGPEDAP